MEMMRRRELPELPEKIYRRSDDDSRMAEQAGKHLESPSWFDWFDWIDQLNFVPNLPTKS